MKKNIVFVVYAEDCETNSTYIVGVYGMREAANQAALNYGGYVQPCEFFPSCE